MNGTTDKSTKKWVVYKHTSPNNKVYIGITSTKPERRWRCGEGYIANKHFYNAIKKYGWDNFKHEILYEGLTLQEASIKEKELIKHFNSMNQNFGYNLTSGGRSDFRFSESALRKMSIRMQGKGNPMYGKTHTQEVRQKLSELFKGANSPWYGRKHTDEEKRKISEAQKGEKHHHFHKHLSEVHKQRIRENAPTNKTVLQIDKHTNKIINEFISTREAERQTGILHQNIGQCCKGNRSTAGGYKWKFKK
jgi:hypothetical protein